MNTTVVNTETMCELLQKLAELKLVCPNSIVLDNTKYQRSTIVQVLVTELGIWLLFLPSNSPNLNVIERIQGLTKPQSVNGKRHADFASF